MQTLQPTGRGESGPQVRAVADFLRRYGYLEPPPRTEAAPQPERFDGAIEEAVAGYQRAHGLPETGQLDPETLRFMNTPRCSVRDSLEATFVAGPAAGWGKRNLTFHVDLINDLPVLGTDVIEREVSIAFAVWAATGRLTFAKQFPADIFAAFRRGDHGDGHPQLAFDGAPGGSLGHAFPPTHARLAGHVHLDADERWSVTLPVTGSADLPTLLLHEIGHALGLEHDLANPSAVMHERFESGDSRRTLDASDVQALAAVYP